MGKSNIFRYCGKQKKKNGDLILFWNWYLVFSIQIQNSKHKAQNKFKIEMLKFKTG